MEYAFFTLATIIMNIVFEYHYFHLFYEMKNQAVPKRPILMMSIIMGVCSITIARFNLSISELLGIENAFVSHFVNLFLYLSFLMFLTKNVKETLVYVAMSYLLWISLYCFVDQAQYLLIQLFSMEHTYLLYGIITLILSVLIVFLSLGARFIIRHFRMDRTFRYICLKMNHPVKIAGLYIIVFLISSLFMRIQSNTNMDMSLQMTLIDLCACLMLVILIRISRKRQAVEEKIMMYELVMSQQEMYIKNLEEIQQNLRTFKHDYKNMMSSLYLQSKEGQMENIEKSLSNMIEEFDENIDSKMNVTNQLANVQMIELKSLLFQKLTKIHQSHIRFHLEVLYPIRQIHMKTMDVLRILGILLDNAIEETKDQGDIILILLNQEDGLHIVVDNSLHHDINLSFIYKEGYSTKGNDRGLGLSGLLKMIENYQEVSHSTTCENGRLRQEIYIGG